MTRYLLIAATLLSGLLAGLDVDRSFVAMPSWSRVGAAPWAAFSRQADLGNGIFLYPFEAVCGFLLTVAAAVSLRRERQAGRRTLWTLYAAAALCAVGLAFTLKAAPVMLGIRGEADPARLQAAFEDFRYWGDFRSVCQTLAFAAQLFALATLRPAEARAS